MFTNAGAHLVDYVEGWGPLWAWSTFGFEDMNGTIKKFAHGTGNVLQTSMSVISHRKNILFVILSWIR